MSDNIKKVLLVGAGYMASEYAKVIFKVDFRNVSELLIGNLE